MAETAAAGGGARTRRMSRTVDGRTYHCSVPVNAQHAAPLPLIVAVHGKGDNGLDFLIGTDFGQAEAIIAAPTGRGLAWSPAPYAVSTVEEDSAFIEAIIADLSQAYPVDPARIYLAGFSNGGGLVAELAANNPEQYAAVATVAGAIRTDLESIAAGAPIDYLNIHGTWDEVVPYAGQDRGSLGFIHAAEAVVDAFTRRNGADKQATARTTHIAVTAMGHEWPAGVWARDGFDATKEILEFFGIEAS